MSCQFVLSMGFTNSISIFQPPVKHWLPPDFTASSLWGRLYSQQLYGDMLKLTLFTRFVFESRVHQGPVESQIIFLLQSKSPIFHPTSIDLPTFNSKWHGFHGLTYLKKTTSIDLIDQATVSEP